MTSDKITLAHGGGGRLSREFIEREIVPRFGSGPLHSLPDAAMLAAMGDRLLFSIDSFVVKPAFFPGGNIGDLAVFGTVNDIAVAGGSPRWLALSLILEEGYGLQSVRQILDTIKDAAARCNVAVATGDTKVVHRGQCDGIYITTAGVGEALPGFILDAKRIAPGDLVLTSGSLGDHGMAVMSVRDSMHFGSGPQSDTGPVHQLVAACGEMSEAVKIMRDPTRGGAASVLHELLDSSSCDIVLREQDLPFDPRARALAEILGFDLLHVASEGRLLAVCDPAAAGPLLERWRSFPEGRQAAVIGRVAAGTGRVVLETAVGAKRLISVPEGELLPRIC